ncbi:IS3 family transposase [Streptomyces shenzhenensis]|uniref:IS3 family transposase n=1 Tax=Streptomyces shenzhenensis TaxID=943815 RepID=UPI0033ECA2D1
MTPRTAAAGSCCSARNRTSPSQDWWSGEHGSPVSRHPGTRVREAFNTVLKVEYVHRQHFRTRTEARIKIGTWIADFYNARRMHSVCGFLSPVEFERQYWAEQVLQEAA